MHPRSIVALLVLSWFLAACPPTRQACDGEFPCPAGQTCETDGFCIVPAGEGEGEGEGEGAACVSDGACEGDGFVCALDRGTVERSCVADNLLTGLAPCERDEECSSRVCVEDNLRCYRSCERGDDCGTGNFCVELVLETAIVGACRQRCDRDRDCDPRSVCAARTERDADAHRFVCALPADGLAAPGEPAEAPESCAHGIVVDDLCSEPCADDFDCVEGQACVAREIPRPSGDGAELFSVCATSPG